MSRYKLNASVAAFSVLFGTTTAAALLFSRAFGKSDEEKIKSMIEKNPSILKENAERREKMKVFFEKMKNNDQDLDQMFSGTLKGGKGDLKRQHKYDGPTSISEDSSLAVKATVESENKSSTPAISKKE
mmetsp:Transcript_20200/g.20300  ORF Transcript_20200/g.20300 Transcript_20200/m.20300 type:complete len:129 (+) Transcript_20200:238-624(+)